MATRAPRSSMAARAPRSAMASSVPGPSVAAWSAMAARIPGSAMAAWSAVAAGIPGSAMAAGIPGSAMAAWSAVAAWVPGSAVGPGTGTALEVTCPVSRSLRPPECPPPLPFRCRTARDAPIGRGGYCQTLSSSAFVSSPIFDPSCSPLLVN